MAQKEVQLPFKMIFHEPIEFPTLLDDIKQEHCDDKILLKFRTHERKLLGNPVESLEIENLVTLEEVYINVKVVDTMTCSKLLFAKVVQSMHPPILGESLLAKVVHYVHPSHFKPHWMEEKVGLRTLNQALVEGQPN